jgi:hypothetical protein
MKRGERIWTGRAISRETFAVSVGILQDEDPLSNFLMFKGSTDTMTGFVEIPRTIMSIAVTPGEDVPEIFAAMSDEGDVYFLEDEIDEEKIPGAGSLSDDSEGFGSMHMLRGREGSLLASGNGSQVYWRSEDGVWVRLCDAASPGVERSTFLAIDARSRSRIAVCGYTNTQYRTPAPNEQRRLDDLAEQGEPADYVEEKERLTPVTAPAAGCLYFFDGAAWRPAELPGQAYLRDLLFAPDDSVIAVGDGGTIVRGPAPDEMEDLSVPGLLERFRSIEPFAGGYVILGDSGVHRFGSDFAFAETVAFPPDFANPNTITAVGDTIWCFGFRAIAVWQSGTWRVMQIPDDYDA